MKKKTIPQFTFLLLFLSPLTLCSQDARFQQQVDYTIDVRLDPETYSLTGHCSFVYYNRSSHRLDSIFLHLWPNAFRDKNTAFAKQKLSQGNLEFYFAGQDELGFIDSLRFEADGLLLEWVYGLEKKEIAVLYLPSPLEPGDSIAISTPFKVRIPKSYSRLGRVGGSYQVTQWYPKPAVFDHEGWHPMPNLDQGEFFSEFGNYRVTIHAPARYIIAATGIQINPETEYFISSLANQDPVRQLELKALSKGWRTWEFRAENVHDFAWFADTSFVILKDSVLIGEDRMVECRAYFPPHHYPLWSEVPGYMKRSLSLFSDLVGDYPYPQMTAVQNSLSRGVNMEYPMITLIGFHSDPALLDQVIAHEVGHIWFYGVLASNERRYPWMDEGLTSYYEQRYTLKYHDEKLDKFFPGFLRRTAWLSDPQLYLAYKARTNTLQSPGLPSTEMTGGNYYLNAYERPALAFAQLADFIGIDVFDKAMQDFYKKWKFKHPAPQDLRKVLEEHCACELDWLFEDLLMSATLPDYALQKTREKGSVRVINKSKNDIPFKLSAIGEGGEAIYEQWQEEPEPSSIMDLPGSYPFTLVLGDENYLADPTPWNNRGRMGPNGKFKNPVKMSFLGGIADADPMTLNVYPAVGWNQYDRAMVGLAVTNNLFYPRNFRIAAAPMYSFNSKEVVGLGHMEYLQFPGSGFYRKVAFRLGVKRFHFDEHQRYGFYNNYLKIEPSIGLELRKKDLRSPISQHLQYRQVYVSQQYGRGTSDSLGTFEWLDRSYQLHELKYSLLNDKVQGPFNLDMVFQIGKGFIKLFADYDQFFPFDAYGRGLWLHGFAGFLPTYDDPEANVNFRISGTTGGGIFSPDYTYDELLLGRNADEGANAQQIFYKDARLRTLGNTGISEDWMVGAGLEISLPLPIPVNAYMDAALFPALFEEGVNLSYSGGFSLPLVKNAIEIYLPLWESKDITGSIEYIERNGVFERLCFLIDLNKFAPFKLMEDNLEQF